MQIDTKLITICCSITQQAGVKSNIKPPPPPATTILDTRSFDDLALDPSKNVLVSFTAPWCGHCKTMKPHYEKVAQTFLSETDCIVANVDADAAPNRPLAERYGVTGFPTIKFFPKGSTTPVDYTGPRSEEGFVQFLNEKCGTYRAVGGGLSATAGRLPELDTLAQKFFSATGDARSAVYNEAVALAETLGMPAKHYIKIMEKVVNGTDTYFEKESKRLGSILSKKSLAPTKLDEIKRKANVLAAFAAAKVEEAKEEGEKLVERVKEEL
jgi:protein disulfide-isomerase A6